MSKDDAIIIIANLEDVSMFFNPCDVQEAKTMAIKAIEQEQEQGPKPGCWLDKDGNVIEVHSWQEWMNYMKRSGNE